VSRLRDESGQASVEFAGVLFWLLLAGLFVWQMMLVSWSFTQAGNAARTASRVEARGGDPEKAGRNALSPGLREHAKVTMAGDKATVKVRIPIVVPGIGTDKLPATKSAELPG